MTARGASRCFAAGTALLILAVVAILRAPAPALAQDDAGLPPIPDAVGYVNDLADVLDETTEAKLEAFLDQLQRKTGAEFAILTVTTTAPETPDAYKVRVFKAWGIGKRGEDNGLLMLLAREERELKFETGYGLEGPLPDGLQSRIFRREMAPRFQSGDFAGGIIAGTQQCAARIASEKGVTLEWDGRELRYSGRRDDGDSPPVAVIIFVVVIAIIMIAARANRRGRRRRSFGGNWDDWGGWGGGFGGWGGGFGGGGWRGGGGGGGSFGGFGGGASGGGGGGGKW
jgi:uncharacterized protein